MSNTQMIMLILFGIVLFLYIVSNIISFSDVEIYKKKYNELRRGVYKYDPNPNSIYYCYFYLQDYDITTQTFSKTTINIIFFPDGAIKLSDNVYIHKWQIWLSLVHWFYYRKFYKLKDVLIEEYNIRKEQRIRAQILFDGGLKKQNLKFKFFRG